MNVIVLLFPSSVNLSIHVLWLILRTVLLKLGFIHLSVLLRQTPGLSGLDPDVPLPSRPSQRLSLTTTSSDWRRPALPVPVRLFFFFPCLLARGKQNKTKQTAHICSSQQISQTCFSAGRATRKKTQLCLSRTTSFSPVRKRKVTQLCWFWKTFPSVLLLFSPIKNVKLKQGLRMFWKVALFSSCWHRFSIPYDLTFPNGFSCERLANLLSVVLLLLLLPPPNHLLQYNHNFRNQ